VARAGDQGIQVTIDSQEWWRLKQSLDAFDPALAKALRKRIRAAGTVGSDAVKKKLRSSGSLMDQGVLDNLAAATKVSVSFSKKSAGAKIKTGSSRLSATDKKLLFAFNQKTFRHPVWPKGDDRTKWAWADQPGRPYFGVTIVEALNRAVIEEVFAALDDATKAIGARSK